MLRWWYISRYTRCRKGREVHKMEDEINRSSTMMKLKILIGFYQVATKTNIVYNVELPASVKAYITHLVLS